MCKDHQSHGYWFRFHRYCGKQREQQNRHKEADWELECVGTDLDPRTLFVLTLTLTVGLAGIKIFKCWEVVKLMVPNLKFINFVKCESFIITGSTLRPSETVIVKCQCDRT